MNTDGKAISRWVCWGGFVRFGVFLGGWGGAVCVCLFGFFSKRRRYYRVIEKCKVTGDQLCITVQFSLHADLKQTPDSNSSIFLYGVRGPCLKCNSSGNTAMALTVSMMMSL